MKHKSLENRIGYVYKITSPRGRVYIGSTVNLISRISTYKTLACKQQTKLYNSLVKYGWENHVFEIIKECLAVNRRKMESFYGFLYNCLDSKTGLNCSLPKIDEEVPNDSEETRIKKSEARKKIGFSQLARDNAQKARLGSKRLIGSQNRCKLVFNTETGIYYNSAKEACATTGFNYNIFITLLNQNNPRLDKTSFIFVDEYKPIKKSGFNNNNRGKMVVNLENGIAHESAKEAYLTYPSIHNKMGLHSFNGVLSSKTSRTKNHTQLIYI